jgi:hypothetical protein
MCLGSPLVSISVIESGILGYLLPIKVALTSVDEVHIVPPEKTSSSDAGCFHGYEWAYPVPNIMYFNAMVLVSMCRGIFGDFTMLAASICNIPSICRARLAVVVRVSIWLVILLSHIAKKKQRWHPIFDSNKATICIWLSADGSVICRLIFSSDLGPFELCTLGVIFWPNFHRFQDPCGIEGGAPYRSN